MRKILRPKWMVLAALNVLLVYGLEQCTKERGGGICPDGNTCCPILHQADDGVTRILGSGCISGGMGTHNATCCFDDVTFSGSAEQAPLLLPSGCPKGYRCAAQRLCRVTASRTPDPLLKVLPRYLLCHSPSMETVHGLPMTMYEDGSEKLELPYYSSHGPITLSSADKQDHWASTVEIAVVVIHGGGRNADDYFCPMMAAVHNQSHYPDARSVLVIAPRFLTLADGPIQWQQQERGAKALRWGGTGHGEWRYGDAAVNAHNNKTITSFDAVDILMKVLKDEAQFPHLKHIVIVGHSVGGQFVQRWSMLTAAWNARMSAVIANPSSWTYLTNLRWWEQQWQVPHYTACPGYNDWTWGLQENPTMHSPYKDDVLAGLGVEGIIERFGQRQVTYLAGSRDRCNVTGLHQWCQSHDLGTTCMDELQGSNRWDRHVRYMKSLELVGIHKHVSRVVEGVGHDHALMFTSPEAASVLFPQTAAPAPSLRLSMLQSLVSLASYFRTGRIAISLYSYCLNIGLCQ